MSSPYLEETFDPFIAARNGRPQIVWVTEPEPLGTGGAIVGAIDRLGDDAFLALNGDILTDLDLGALVGRHHDRRADATIAMHHVEDARPFGLIEADGEGRITRFLEKPATPVSGDINAGTYVLDPTVLRRWEPGRPASIERDVFPALIAGGATVVGVPSDAYWLDLGTPEQYIRAHADLLDGRVRGRTYAAPWVGGDARVHPTATVAPSVTVGAGCLVGEGAELWETVLLPGAQVGASAHVRASIVGPRAVVGDGASLEGSVLGEGARVPDGAALTDARISAGALAEPA